MTRRPGFLTYGLLLVFAIGSAAPLYWSFLLGSHTREVAAQGTPPLIPGGHFIDNASRALDAVPFWKALGNSLMVSSVTACSVVVFCTLAGLRLRQAALPRQRAVAGVRHRDHGGADPARASCPCSS